MTFKKLSIGEQVYGPYTEVEVLPDRYRVDGSDLPFVVVGNGGVISDWTDPIPEPEIYIPVPAEVTMRQARLALLDAELLADVLTAIDQLSEPTKTKAMIEWEYSNVVKRDGPMTMVLGQLMGLSSEEIDNLFINAATL